MDQLQYDVVAPTTAASDVSAVAPYMFWLMMRNVASDGFVFEDPVRPGVLSTPGCILASPSWENTASHVTQDYVYNWTRDAAVVALELADGPLPTSQPLTDYVTFARTCQTSGGDFDRAAFLINGTPRDWTDQTDGPALQTSAVLRLFPQLDAATQAIAATVVQANVAFLQNTYRGETFNLWEEEFGASFFARAVQLRCLQDVTSNTAGIPIPGWIAEAVPWLRTALAGHWNGHLYQSMLPVPTDHRAPYDPNIDIVMASIYGAVPVTDTQLLATAALIRAQWADPSSGYAYPVNTADQQRNPAIGPLLGRYPGDVYDGDTDAQVGDHPWAVSTANFAELYYRLAHEITASGTLPLDALSTAFFAQIGVDASCTPAAASAALRSAGDRMLQAVIFHSDHLELSEQFDAVSGFEKSVSNLSWSYASFLSAVRARSAVG